MVLRHYQGYKPTGSVANHVVGMCFAVHVAHNSWSEGVSVMCSTGPDSSFDEALADALELGQNEVAKLASVVEGAIGAYDEAGAKLVRGGDEHVPSLVDSW